MRCHQRLVGVAVLLPIFSFSPQVYLKEAWHMQEKESNNLLFPERCGGDGRNRTADRDFADPCLDHLATSPAGYECTTNFSAARNARHPLMLLLYDKFIGRAIPSGQGEAQSQFPIGGVARERA